MTMNLAGCERFVELSHGRTRYFELGNGPPLILLHGVSFTAGANSWYQNVKALSSELRVLAVDFVGWGLGDRLSEGYSFAYLVDFVREFQDVLGLPSSHLAGQALGGWVASIFAYESPHRVDKLVLIGSGGLSTQPTSPVAEFIPPTREQIFKRIAALPRLTPAEADDWTEYEWANTQAPLALDSYRKILEHMKNKENRNRYNTARRLPIIASETLVMWGTRDGVNSLEIGQQTSQLIRNSRLVTFDSGHMIQAEVPDEFNASLLEFLT